MKLAYAWDKPGPNTGLSNEMIGEFDHIKVGKAVFTALGPVAVETVHRFGGKVFLDLKYHDIPNTVSEAVKAACDLGVDMLNVHVSGGMAMMQAAARAAEDYDTKVIGVTLLTSVREGDLEEVGLTFNYRSPEDREGLAVEIMAMAARNGGLDGVVCSAQEAQRVHNVWADELHPIIVCPAIRPDWSVSQDQKRPTTPKQALDAGATEIVLGRAVSAPPPEIGTPDNALKLIREELGQ